MSFLLFVAVVIAFALIVRLQNRARVLESKIVDLEIARRHMERRLSQGVEAAASLPAAAPPAVEAAPVEIVQVGAAPVEVVPPEPAPRRRAAEPEGAPEPPAAAVPEATVRETSPPVPAAGPSLDTWETKIGGSWLNRIGIALLVIGITLALGYSFTRFGQAGKAALATVISFALIGSGVFLERREGYAFYARGLIGGGWAALYATAYAIHELEATKIVESAAVGFLLLLAVGAGMIIHSLRYRNQGLTALAYGLAYAAIVLEGISGYTLSAASLLGAGTVTHLLGRRWYGLAIGGAAATYGSLLLWYAQQEPMTLETLRLGLGALAINWVVFLVAEFGPDPSEEEERNKLRIVNFLNATCAGGLSFAAWRDLAPAAAWMPLALVGSAYAVTSIALRRLGRTVSHPAHSLAAALLVAGAAHQGLELQNATWVWLAEAQIVVLLGAGLKDRFHRILGCALFLLPMVAILHDQAGPRLQRAGGLFDLPQILLTAAACGCFYLTYARLGQFAADGAMRRLFSYGAFAVILLGLWVQMPAVHLAPASAILALLLFEISVLRQEPDLRIQAYLAALYAAGSTLALTAPSHDLLAGLPARVPAMVVVSLCFFVLFMRLAAGRRRLIEVDSLVRPLLSWMGALLVCLAVWLEARATMVGPAWMLLALLVVEAGIALKEADLRRPGYAVLLAAQLSLVLSNLLAPGVVSGQSVRLFTVAPAIVATYYLWWRLRALSLDAITSRGDRIDERFGRVLSYAGAALAGLFFRFQFGLDGAALRWSLAMVALFVAGYLLRDADFRIQAYGLAAAVMVRAIGFDFQNASPILGVNGPLAVAVVGLVSYIAAGQIVGPRERAGMGAAGAGGRVASIETWLAPHGRDILWSLAVLIAAIYLYRTLSEYKLIVAWAIEGSAACAAGFGVRVRSVRLAGLGLLAIGLAMTFYRTFTTSDTLGRIISFLVMGAVLLLISFAYTRYREVIRRNV